MFGLNEVQPSRFAGYLIMLKSPKTHQAELHLTLTLSSFAYKVSLRLELVGPYTPIHNQTKPSATPFNKTETKKLPTTQSISHTPCVPGHENSSCSVNDIQSYPIYKKAASKTFHNKRVGTVQFGFLKTCSITLPFLK